MRKIKIIGSYDYKNLEEQVNNFCIKKSVIDIKYQSQYITTTFIGGIPKEGAIYDRAMIIYEE